MFSTKANMNIHCFYINPIAICICNGLKCWFKHPLPLSKDLRKQLALQSKATLSVVTSRSVIGVSDWGDFWA